MPDFIEGLTNIQKNVGAVFGVVEGPLGMLKSSRMEYIP
jgi:hypothetical protein